MIAGIVGKGHKAVALVADEVSSGMSIARLCSQGLLNSIRKQVLMCSTETMLQKLVAQREKLDRKKPQMIRAHNILLQRTRQELVIAHAAPVPLAADGTAVPSSSSSRSCASAWKHVPAEVKDACQMEVDRQLRINKEEIQNEKDLIGDCMATCTANLRSVEA